MWIREKEDRLHHLRRRFTELQEELNKVREEWSVAHNGNDLREESKLLAQVTAILGEVNHIVTEFSSMMRFDN